MTGIEAEPKAATSLLEPVAPGQEKDERVRPQSALGRTWKRRLAVGAIAAVLAVIIYFGLVSQEPTVERQEKEAVTPKSGPAKIEVEAPRPAEQPRAPLVLKIPSSRPVDVDVYVVRKGDTLWNISKRFTGDPFNYPHIAGENKIGDPDLILPGQKIHLKKQ